MLVQVVVTAASLAANNPNFIPNFANPSVHVKLMSIDYLGTATANKLVQLVSPFRDYGGQYITFQSLKDTTNGQNSFSASSLNIDLGYMQLTNYISVIPTVAGSVADCANLVLWFDMV